MKKILDAWDFDYRIGSVHFLWGWGFDASKLIDEWSRHDLRDVWAEYAAQVELLAASGNYDILGHPFNVRLFKHFPNFDTTPCLERVAEYNLPVTINSDAHRPEDCGRCFEEAATYVRSFGKKKSPVSAKVKKLNSEHKVYCPEGRQK